MMFTLEEIVDLDMATDSYNLNLQSKTPYTDLTQVETLPGPPHSHRCLLDQEAQGEPHQATHECLHEMVTNREEKDH